jgi:membrane-associated phospholipid phosphatase
MMRLGRRTCLAVLALLSATATGAGAQRPVLGAVVQHDTTGRAAHTDVPLLTSHDAVVAAGVTGLVLALMPADRSIAHAFQRHGVQSNSALKSGADIFNAVGFPGVIVFSAGSYFLGLGTHSRPAAALGMHTGEAIVLGGAIDEVLKGAIGRARPYKSFDDAYDFHPGKGFASDAYTSLPSGHVTLAFAAATMASREVSRSWPGAARYVTPASYGTAMLVALARAYKNQHWASDVVGAAGVGTLAGVVFDRYNRGHPNNIFDRIFLPASIVPEQGGAAVAWTVPVHW